MFQLISKLHSAVTTANRQYPVDVVLVSRRTRMNAIMLLWGSLCWSSQAQWPQLAAVTASAQQSPLNAHAHHHHAVEAKGAETQVYSCSMHPQIRLTDPAARCPICGMALIAVPNDQTQTAIAGSTELRLNATAAALLQTQVVPARIATSVQSLSLPGTLVVDQTKVHTISAWTAGRIEHAYVNRTAQQVTAGEPMLELFSPDLIIIQQELLQAKQLFARQPSSGGKTLESARRRLRLLGVPASQIDRILQQEQSQETVTISAPISGVVTEKMVNPGAYVTAGQPLFTLVSFEQLWLELALVEAQLAQVKLGQKVQLSFTALPGEQFQGIVSVIEPILQADSRTARLRVVLDNPQGRLKPGMLARATLQHELPATLLIPASAVLFTGKQSLVYVQPDATAPHYQPRQVTLGAQVGAEYQILSGLTEGDLVVSQGAFRLDSELQIRGLPSMLNPHNSASAATAVPLSHSHGAQGADDHSSHTPAATPSDFVLTQEQQQPLLAAYQQSYQALLRDDLAGWQQATKLWQQHVAAVEWPEHFPRILTALNAGVTEIATVETLHEARQLFYRHNLGLLRLAELGVLASGWYEAYCPMARDGKGAAWLQPTMPLQNPYFGAEMLGCGDIVRQFGQKE